MPKAHLRPEDYTVGWVSALPTEDAAAAEMLDEEHSEMPLDSNDSTLYTLGRIGEHNVVLACLPAGRTGTNSAASVATQMISKFKGIRFGLMVGIGGGVPSEGHDVRLGDVVVSQPYGQFGGVVQYDLGKSTTRGFERTGSLNAPPQVLLSAVAKLQSNHLRGRDKLHEHLSAINRLEEFTREHAGPDILFEPAYNHERGPTCKGCDKDRLVDRIPRQKLKLHYGTIASGNQVIKNAATRDSLSEQLNGVLCFEMEAAGLMNNFPCLVIRGICDYSDSHKNKAWQPYAAAVAAACAKEILSLVPPTEVAKTTVAAEAVRTNTVTNNWNNYGSVGMQVGDQVIHGYQNFSF